MKFWFAAALIAALSLVPAVAFGQDADGDGRPAGALDCDDTDPTVYTNAPEVCDDGIDQSCDGEDRVSDEDEDGYPSSYCQPAAPAPDCDDLNPLTYPGALERCNGQDDDCDAQVPTDEVDLDGDLSLACSDCDDGDPLRSPGFDEDGPTLCLDGIDNDCDLAIDDGDEQCWSAPTLDEGERIQRAIPETFTEQLTAVVADPNPTDDHTFDWVLTPLGETSSEIATLDADAELATIEVTSSGEGPWRFAVEVTATDSAGLSATAEWELVYLPQSITEPEATGCAQGGHGASALAVLALLAVLGGRERRRLPAPHHEER